MVRVSAYRLGVLITEDPVPPLILALSCDRTLCISLLTDALPDRARKTFLRDLTVDPTLAAARLDLSVPGLEHRLLMATPARRAKLNVLASEQAGPFDMMPLAVSMTDVVCRWLVPVRPVLLQVKLGSTVV